MPLHTLPYSSGAAWGAPRRVQGCGSCRVSCSCGPGRAGTLIGRRKAPKALRPSAREDRTTRGLVQARSSLEPSAHQQSHPAHVVVRAGIVWRTSAHKGSPFLRRRAPAPNTADHEGSPGGSRSLASHRGTLRRGGEKCRSAERAGGGSRRSYLQVPRPGTARRDAHTDKKALRAGRPAGRAEHRPRRRWRARLTGNGVGQEPLRPLRRGREAPRLDVPDSTGSVPLQSG